MSNRKPRGYWQNEQNMIQEINKVIEELGKFPSERQLKFLGRQDIPNAARRHYGGLRALRQKMGYKQSKKPVRYWTNRENFEQELQKVIKQLGHFPTRKEFRGLGRGDLLNAMQKHYGGAPAVRNSMGYKLERRQRGYWKNFKNLRLELEQIAEDLNHFPTTDEISQKGGSTLLYAVYKHGGINKVRQRMGKEKSENIGRPYGHWKNWENIEKVLQKLTDQLGHFPTTTDLENVNLSTVPVAISKYHGGMDSVKDRLGEKAARRPRKYLQKWNNFEAEMKRVIGVLGHFPVYNELDTMGESSLGGAARKYYGGIQVVKERMGYSQQSDQQLESLLKKYANGENENGSN